MTLAPPILDLLLRPVSERADCETLDDWLPHWNRAQLRLADAGPFTAAIDAALGADRLAWAFFSGYKAAVQASFPDRVPSGRVAAFCANESGRRLTDIATTLHATPQGQVLQGGKSWVVAGVRECCLLVLARRVPGPARGPGSLVVVQLASSHAGVALAEGPALAMVPELPHAGVGFEKVQVQALQEVAGDGYADYARPFRLREDVFVTGCTLAYLLAEGLAGAWPKPWCQRCVAAILGLHTCAQLNPHEAQTHVLTAGCLAQGGEVIASTESLWLPQQAQAQARWLRDQSLLHLGHEARRQRAVAAWERLAHAPSRH